MKTKIIAQITNSIVKYSEYFMADKPNIDLLKMTLHPFYRECQQLHKQVRELFPKVDLTQADPVSRTLENLPREQFNSLYKNFKNLYDRRKFYADRYNPVVKFMRTNRSLFTAPFTPTFFTAFLSSLETLDPTCRKEFEATNKAFFILLAKLRQLDNYRAAILSPLEQEVDTLPSFLYYNSRITAFFFSRMSQLKKLAEHFDQFCENGCDTGVLRFL